MKGNAKNRNYERDYWNKLHRIPRSEWPRIYYSINEWNWPDELGTAPEGFAKGKSFEEAKFIMEVIEIKCDKKAMARYEHIMLNGESEQYFEDWWDSKQQRELHETLYRFCNDLTETVKTFRVMHGLYGGLIALGLVCLFLGLFRIIA